MQILDKVYVNNGASRLESYMKAIIAAFIDLKIHHSSKNVELKMLYEKIVLHIYDQLNHFKKVETTRDQNGSLMCVVSITVFYFNCVLLINSYCI